MAKKDNKRQSRKKSFGVVSSTSKWSVIVGRLVPGRGRPKKVSRLFEVVGEKLPFECLGAVSKTVIDEGIAPQGVYMAHDSIGVARYGGRGNVFSRLHTRWRKHPDELLYFSFYIIKNKNHEREIETAIIRAAGGQMTLNERKVRMGIGAGSVSDYEPGTFYFQRQKRKGRKSNRKKAKS